MSFPISRQGMEQIALILIAGGIVFLLLAYLAHRGGQAWRRHAKAAGAIGGLAVICYALAYTVAPNVPVLPVPFTARFAQNPAPDTTATIDAGRAVFQANCVICHGARGTGDGPAALTLNPRPANLNLHVPQHAPGELYYWISEGVANTQMPAWKGTLGETDRWSVIRYLQALVAGRVPN